MHISQKVFQAHYLQYQTYCILVEHNLCIDHNTTAYIAVANIASWERGYANCNSTYFVKASTLSGMRLSFKISCSKLDIQIEPSPVGSRVELHPLAHAQFASWNSVQRLSPKKGASDKNSPTGTMECGLYCTAFLPSLRTCF